MSLVTKGSVLIIEDDILCREIVAEYLSEVEINNIELENALAVEQVLAEQSIDVVLLDIMLPFQDGFETLRKIRDAHPQLPVITMSSSLAYLQMSSLLGANDTLLKPFGSKHLINSISNYLNKKAA